MNRQLVLIHGRSQQNKDAGALKAEWLEALSDGLAKSGLSLPIGEAEVRFPYYGDTLAQLVADPARDPVDVVVRGAEDDPREKAFLRAVVEEVRAQGTAISEDDVRAVLGAEVIERGVQNHEWVHGLLTAIDRFVPFGSGLGIAVATRDVYRYLRSSAIREQIELGVAQAFTAETPAVVCGHSLGSVVAYGLLRREGHLRRWEVPQFVTVGSPLAVTEIRKSLRAIQPLRTPECVGAWVNAWDERDIVALRPLNSNTFPIDPAEPMIENLNHVRNKTDNRHGIAGYLDDAVVARRIYDALVA